jgi:HemK-related putative methylase
MIAMVIYEPHEDSELLAAQVKKHAAGMVLDMGTGSGIQAITAAQNKNVKKVLAVDINRKALKHAKHKSKHAKITYKESDMFSRVEGTFDTMICNPPYLPDDPLVQDIALDGGKKGWEWTEQFLSQAGNHLKKNGQILLLFSSLTKKEKVEEIIEDNCFSFRKLSSQKHAFEELYVYKIAYSEHIQKLMDKRIINLKKLAKGHRGLIYTGMYKNKKVSCKLQRTDIGAREKVNNEITQLKKLNKKNIGPQVIMSGKDFFVYHYVDGIFILDFIRDTRTTKKAIKDVLVDVFTQMKKMDEMGLNKEEMHHPTKHVLITKKKVVLLDFERCKSNIKVHNVSQFCEFIARISPELKKRGLSVEPKKMRDIALHYKKEPELFTCIVEYIQEA